MPTCTSSKSILSFIGIGFCFLNGLGITKARISPFVMTLCMDFILRGLYLIYTKGQPRGIVPNNLRFIGRGRILNIVPVAFLIWIGIAFLFILVLYRTTWGHVCMRLLLILELLSSLE